MGNMERVRIQQEGSKKKAEEKQKENRFFHEQLE